MQNPQPVLEMIASFDAMVVWTDKNKISLYESTA